MELKGGKLHIALDELCRLAYGTAFSCPSFASGKDEKGKPYGQVIETADRTIGGVPCLVSFCRTAASEDVPGISEWFLSGNAPSRSARTYCRLAALLHVSGTDTEEIGFCFHASAGGRETVTEGSEKVAELEQEWEQLSKDAVPSLLILYAHERDDRATFSKAVFPYEDCRDGQEELMKEAYRDIMHGTDLFVQAPTGIGKTISVLYPAIRALGRGSADKIFYLTAKTSGKKEAFGACARLYASGTRLRSIMITAKEQICPWQERFRLPTRTGPVCVRGECPLLEAGTEKWRGALHELLAGYHGFDKKTIRQTAAKWGVCPYELSLDLSEFCDAVICDYNYVFDKNVRFERYFDKKTSEKYVFLIDEAHNLPDRIRQTYSGQISLEGLMAFREEAQELPAELENGMSELLGVFTAAMDLCADSVHETGEGGRTGFWMSREMPVFLSDGVCNGYKIFSEWLRKNRGAACAPAVWRLVETYRRFADLTQLYHTGFMTYVEILGDNVIIRLYCLDPTSIARESLSMAHASVLFSATLTPADYFKDILGGGEGAVSVSLPSPFPQDNLCVAAVTTISTRYEDRTKSADRIVSCIAATVCGKRGNYIVYLPSYAYLELVSGRFAKKYPKVTVTVQKQDMNAAQRDEFLGLFVENEQQLHIGFCVLGGLFAEGIDLPGSRLIGSIIVGTGLPGLSNEGNILRDYYQMKNEDGFNYAYTYPGMNRVLQAAGRVIRTEKDKGIVVLLDDRYATPLYKDMMPPHWSHIKFADSAASLADIVRRFWASKGEAQK